MSDLSIDITALGELSDQLLVVRSQFESAERFSKAVADLAGDPRLADVLRDFADKWNIRRDFLNDDITLLSETALSIRETFIDLDVELAAGLPGAGSGSGGGGGGGQ